MELQSLRSSFLGLINDNLQAFEFEEQIIVDMPFHYSDGDRISLIVLPFEAMFKVTDGGSTALKLQMAGINMTSGAVRDTWEAMVSGIAQQNFSPEGDEIAVVVEQSKLSQALMDVAFGCVHSEHARLKATKSRRKPFTDQVDSRIGEFISYKHPEAIWEKRRAVPLASGRRRPVTGVFRRKEVGSEALYVQAVGGATKQERNDPADKAYTIFSNIDSPKEDKLVVAIGEISSWDRGVVRELNDVAQTVFFDEPAGLEDVLNRHIHKRPLANQQ